MTEIRAKDRLFLAAAVPLALLAAYWFAWRADAGRQAAELERRLAGLATEEGFPGEIRRAEGDLADARAELERERGVPMPQTTMKSDALSTPASRDRLTMQALRDAGLVVVGSADSPDSGRGGARSARGGSALAATGVCPNPRRRTYTADGRYPDVVRALKSLSEREMAVVPDCVLMRPSGRGRWTLEIWQ